MKWQGRRGSENMEDRRGVSGRKVAAGGGIGTLVIILLIWLLGGNPAGVIQQMGTSQETTQSYQPTAQEDSLVRFVSVVLADTEEIWTEIFRKEGLEYRKPKLVVFTGSVSSACGYASAATGPFYCPTDEKIYIDVSFYEEMKRNYNAKGDFSFAYVIAHEVGHHVQNVLGTLNQSHKAQAKVSKKDANRIQVMVELQADFYAGVWAHHQDRLFGRLDAGDIEEALAAAAGVGDDRIQKQAQGYIVPDSFTHGTSAQRSFWFNKGYTTGDINQGNTFEELDK